MIFGSALATLAPHRLPCACSPSASPPARSRARRQHSALLSLLGEPPPAWQGGGYKQGAGGRPTATERAPISSGNPGQAWRGSQHSAGSAWGRGQALLSALAPYKWTWLPQPAALRGAPAVERGLHHALKVLQEVFQSRQHAARQLATLPLLGAGDAAEEVCSVTGVGCKQLWSPAGGACNDAALCSSEQATHG